jgi:hypothetical protein
MPVSAAEFEFGGSPPPGRLCSDEEYPQILVANGLDLAEYIFGLAAQWAPSEKLQLTPEIVLECGRLTVKGIIPCAGEWRSRHVDFEGYSAPPWKDVPEHVDEFCRRANSISGDPALSAAYILWRVRWIHPFFDGNSRVARALAYAAFLVGHGDPEIPGVPFVSKLMDAQNVDEYHAGFDEATKAWDGETVNVDRLKSLISGLFIEQMDSAHGQSAGPPQ